MTDQAFTYSTRPNEFPPTPSSSDVYYKSSQPPDGYLPTPNSAIHAQAQGQTQPQPHPPTQTQLYLQRQPPSHPPSQNSSPSHSQSQIQSHSPHPPHPSHQYPHHSEYSPSPHHDWQQQSQPQPQPQAGPSTYRRQSASGSPASMPNGAHSRDPSAHGEGRRNGARRMDMDEGDGRVGVDDPCGERSYTELKCLGDGSFGTVWLCDWHSPVKPGVLLSAMQCGAGARPEWAGKRLVALKRMKRVWEGGWSQAKSLGELVSLRRIPPHPAIIPLYDAFISPKSRELYFVFECMEGNLYQLTKSRRGRPLAAGLIASCFHQITTGLYHIHQHGYFHRDMKPENLLVTTTGLTDYLTASALTAINAQRNGSGGAGGGGLGADDGMTHTMTNGDLTMRYEKDVSVIVKLADFGLARATASRPPYTEYVSTRWYRAPEVLLRSTEYGPPVDMWALGTILAEMLNLKPLFPGASEIDQVYRICETLGDPSPDYGIDERGKVIGGGPWNTGIKLAKNVGFSFPKRTPSHFRGLFNDEVPQSLVDCIADLLRYNPKYRLTSAQCIDHPYFHETLPHLQHTLILPRIPFLQGQPTANAARQATQEMNVVPPRQVPPSHSHQPHDTRPAFANGDIRNLPPPVGTPDNMANGNGRVVYFPPSGHREDAHVRSYASSALVNQLRELDLPTDDLASYGSRPALGNRADSKKESVAQSSMYDGSNFEGSIAEGSNQSYPGSHSLSVSSLHISERTHPHQPHPQQPQYAHQPRAAHQQPPPQQQMPPTKPHVAAYVQQQQQQMGMYDETPRISPGSQIPTPPPVEPARTPSKLSAIPAPPAPAPVASVGKKKKWGLSSVFGSSEKHLPVVDEGSVGTGYQGSSSSSLKRTQSGNHPDARIMPMATLIEDPKKAKKEAERQARELERAKREAAERAQKERARAVMRKREQLIEAKRATNSKAELEFGDSGFNLQAEAPSQLRATPSQAYIQPVHPQGSGSALQLGASATGSQHQLQHYPGMPASQSVSSVRSHESARSHHSGHSQLSAAALAARDRMEDGLGHGLPPGQGQGQGHGPHSVSRGNRHKARRRDDDDDHSMSSFDVNSLRSRSVLTVGTIDSDPGPRRAHQWTDPADPAARRQPSVSAFRHASGSKSRLMSGSNPSLDSQLAHDFGIHANLASGSSTSLGRHAASQLSLHDMPVGGIPPQVIALGQGNGQGQGSAPTSPYGHPLGAAVAHGHGMGRDQAVHSGQGGQGHGHGQAQGQGQHLPSISDWQGGYHAAQINPMFRVPPAQNQGQKTTLPPFSAIASVADAQAQAQAQRQNQG